MRSGHDRPESAVTLTGIRSWRPATQLCVIRQTSEEYVINNISLIILIVFSLVNASGCSSVNTRSTNPNQIEAEVMDAFRGLVEASKALDSSRYFEYVDKDKFTGLSADGKAWHSIRDLEDVILSGFPMVDKIVSLEFYNVKVTVINQSTAILVNEYKQTILLKNKNIVKQSGGGTQVWSKSENAWKLVSISASDASHHSDPVF